MKVWQICVFIHINFGWLCSCVNHIQSNACRRFIMKSSLLRFTKSIYCPDLVQTRLGKIKTLGATVSVFALKQCQELRILLTFLHCKGNSCGARLPFFCPACCRRRGQSQGMKFGDGINWMDRAFWKWSIQRAQDKLQNGPPSSFFCFPRLMRQDRAVGACSLQDKSIYQEAAAQILLNLLQDPGPPNTFH